MQHNPVNTVVLSDLISVLSIRSFARQLCRKSWNKLPVLFSSKVDRKIYISLPINQTKKSQKSYFANDFCIIIRVPYKAKLVIGLGLSCDVERLYPPKSVRLSNSSFESKAPFTLYRFHMKTVWKCSVLTYRLHYTAFLSGIK